MNDIILILLYTTASCTVVGALGLIALRQLRHRRLRLTIILTALVPVVAVGVSAVVNVQAMFLSRHDSVVVLIALGWATVIAALMTVMVSRLVTGGSEAIRDRLRQLDGEAGLANPTLANPTLANPGRPADGAGAADPASAAIVRAEPAPNGGRSGTPAELSTLVAELDTIRTRLAASRNRERALETSRRELVSFMSHDLRTPLTGLRVLAEALDDGVIDDVPAAMNRVHGYVDRMTTLVDDLFELSRVTSGAERRSRQLVSLSEIAMDVVAETEDLARSLGVEVVLELSSDDDRLPVLGDGDELARAMTNLVVNAVRHTAAGGVVRVQGDRADDGRIRIAVADGCGGIPATDLPYVFDAGWRGSPSRSADDGGAGFGLAIARGVAESHAGQIKVRNVDGGCRFELALPVARS